MVVHSLKNGDLEKHLSPKVWTNR